MSDYYYCGNKNHILSRFGDGYGNPYEGPIQVAYLHSNLYAILSVKSKIITIQHILGSIQHSYYPLTHQSLISSANVNNNIDNNHQILDNNIFANDDSIKDSSMEASIDEEIELKDMQNNALKLITYLDMEPTDISKIPGHNQIVISDRRMLIHIIDLETHQIVHSFCKKGFKQGELLLPRAIDVCKDFVSGLFYFIGDNLENQKLHVYNEEYQSLIDVGEYGPARKQFRDILSVSCFNPFTPSYYTHYIKQRHLDCLSTKDTTVNYLAVNSASSTINHLAVNSTSSGTNYDMDAIRNDLDLAQLPFWYKGEQSLESLEEIIYDEKYEGNFVIGKRIGSTSNSSDSNTDTESVYELLYLTPSKRLEQWCIKEQHSEHDNNIPTPSSTSIVTTTTANTRHKKQYYISNSLLALDKKELYPSVYELIRIRKGYKLGDDRRRYMYVAAVDRGNFRVQIFRFYHTQSFMFVPEMQLLYVVGGIRNKYVELVRPTAACYSPTGELAICDTGNNKILLLSRSMQLLKWFSIPYESPEKNTPFSTTNNAIINNNSTANNTQKNLHSQMTQQPQISQVMAGKSSGMSVSAESGNNNSQRTSSPTKPHSSRNSHIKTTASTIPTTRITTQRSTWDESGDSIEEKEREQRMKMNNQKPCDLCFSDDKHLVVGYQNGGVYIYKAYQTYVMGTLKVDDFTLEYMICNYLTYQDIQSLRNCCVYLHNFTRNLRLTWRIFPLERQLMINKVVSLFIQWSKLDGEGIISPSFVLQDFRGRDMCLRHLKLECPDHLYCTNSHETIIYDRFELASLQAYITYEDLFYFISVLYGPNYIWKYEAYMEALFHSFGDMLLIYQRKDEMSRKNETIRKRTLENTRVLKYSAYLEIMTLLEEQYNDYKTIQSHKLFTRNPKNELYYIPPMKSLNDLDGRMIISSAEQNYDKPFNVPAITNKGKRFLTLKNMENVVRLKNTRKDEYLAICDLHIEKAVAAINKLFN